MYDELNNNRIESAGRKAISSMVLGVIAFIIFFGVFLLASYGIKPKNDWVLLIYSFAILTIVVFFFHWDNFRD